MRDAMPPLAQVPADVAYEAAVRRATRTQQALILAEAQTDHFKRLYVQAESARAEAVTECERLKRELDLSEGVAARTKEHLYHRIDTLKGRAEGVTDGQDESAEAGAEPECAAG